MPSQLINRFQVPLFVLLVAVASPRDCSAFAFQDDDPFGGGGANKQDVNEDPFGNPFGGDPSKPPTTSVPSGTGKAALPKTVDKVVLAIRETNPATPVEFMNALRIMFDTRNYEEAKSYLDKLIAANVNDKIAFDLVEDIGSDFVIRMMRSKQMAPLGATYGRKLLTAANRHITSEAQLQQLFADLTSPSATKRNGAQRGFRLAGIPGLIQLVKNGSAANPTDQLVYQTMAASISSRVIQPLHAVLASGTDEQRLFATAVLGLSQSKKSVPFLLSPLLSPTSPSALREVAQQAFKRILGGQPEAPEAKRFLRKQIEQLVGGATPFNLDGFGMASDWTWSADGKLVSRKVAPQVARILRLERLGRILHDIDPQDPTSNKIYLASQLTALKVLGNKTVSEILPDEQLKAISPSKWISVLEYCLDKKLFEGAIGTVEIMGKVVDESILRSSDFSPLIKAMESGDRQLRFACTEAIMRLKPTRSFPGANKFMDSLVFFSGTRGTRRALIAHPKIAEGQNLVGALAQRGLDADATTTGRGIYRRAVEDPDVEFLLISDAIDQPPLGELLTQLRSNPALKRIPIGILSQDYLHERNLQIAEFDEKTIAIRQPYRISFRVEQILPVDNAEINNAIISWTVLSDILKQSLDQNNRSVAIQVLDTMRTVYNDDLSKLDVDNSAILSAMNSLDRAIRSRAARIFLRISGEKPLYEKPMELPVASGRVLIVHPRGTELKPMTDKLKEAGFTVAVVGSVENAVQAIPSIPSLKFVIGSNEFGGLGATEIRKALSKKYRLNPVPISFVDRADSYREAPVAKPVFDTQIESLIGLNGRQTAELTRIQQARASLDFLFEIISDRESYDYLNPIRHEKRIIASLRNPALATQSLKVLGELATPNAQQVIVDFASNAAQSPTLRIAATDAFETAVKKRGILLTKSMILKQYDRYNKSESLDKATQQIFGRILDIIEAPAKKNSLVK